VAVEIAWSRLGATPKQPSMGSSGSVRRPSCDSGVVSVAVHASRSISQSARIQVLSSACGRLRASLGSTTWAASTAFDQPVGRFGTILSIVSTSVSPGSAPSIKNGPVIGLPGGETTSPRSSRPLASIVVVMIVSPGCTCRAGS
jgi:hypothetical protein